MGAQSWTFLNDGLEVAAVARGHTAGLQAPPGGDSFVYAFNSLVAATGAVALFCNQANFAPIAKGASVRGCMKRAPGGGPTGFAPMMFVGCQGTSVNDTAYLLGLSDEDPHRIVLRKGAIVGGVPASQGPGVLLASADSFALGSWHHLRLDATVNTNGDVALRVLASDLQTNPLSGPPDWQPVDGMPLLIDDHLGINTASLPLTSGRAGFGFQVSDVTRRAYFDHLRVIRHL